MRAYLLVESEDGDRICWRLREAEINDTLDMPTLAEFEDISRPYRPGDNHELTMSGKADWRWTPSQVSARWLKEAFKVMHDDEEWQARR